MKPPVEHPPKDLIVLVADKNMETTLAGLLERSRSLGVAPITCDLFVHPHRDPGCLNEGDDFLRALTGAYRYALVLFDHQGWQPRGAGRSLKRSPAIPKRRWRLRCVRCASLARRRSTWNWRVPSPRPNWPAPWASHPAPRAICWRPGWPTRRASRGGIGYRRVIGGGVIEARVTREVSYLI